MMPHESSHDPPPAGRLASAFDYACRVHGGHLRKGTSIPYISHLMATAALVMEHGGDEDTAIAALLHDAIEDHPTRTSRGDIEARFGRRVADVVAAVTEPPKAGHTWKERKAAYLEQLRHAPYEALLVSACDKAHNLAATLADAEEQGPEAFARFNAPPADMVARLQELAELYEHRGLPARLMRRVWNDVKRLEAFA
jgi:(p)ppGpp synthase/HD superfamily hydrolase